MIADEGGIPSTPEASLEVARKLLNRAADVGINLDLGASNVSFSMTDRKIIKVAYLTQVIVRGLLTAITDPMKVEIRTTLLACDLLMGRDEYAMRWIKAYSKCSKPASLT